MSQGGLTLRVGPKRASIDRLQVLVRAKPGGYIMISNLNGGKREVGINLHIKTIGGLARDIGVGRVEWS